MTMTRRILPGTPPVEITLRRTARARRYSLRVSRLDGQVTLSLPLRAPEAEAMAFVRDKADWIRAALCNMPARTGRRVGRAGAGRGADVDPAWRACGRLRSPRARFWLPTAPVMPRGAPRPSSR